MQDDLISREETLTAFADYVGSGMSMNDYDALCDIVEKMPAVKQEPKTGHWIAQDIYNCHTDFKCSECGYIHSFMHLYGKPTADYTYCPSCGAKMIEPQERSDKE